MAMRFIIQLVIICSLTSTAFAVSRAISIEQNKQSVYQLYAVSKDKKTVVALGNAVAVTENYLVTNCHVALGGNFLIARVGNTPHMARICFYNKSDDLCLVDVQNVRLNPAIVKSSRLVKLHENVHAIANLKERGTVVTHGKITSILKQHNHLLLQTDAELSHGSSGGGLFDRNGYLIGITSSGIPAAGIGYAIPTDLIMEAIDPKNLPHCVLPKKYSVLYH